jgi:glycosyltransferase involved in cell wall biosynthesis
MSVSVIIPARNAALLLGPTIQSVLSQSRAADEVLVIDDGSSDETFAVASAFGTPVRVIRQQNMGLMATRNRGVEIASGEWIAFIDADDLWEPEKLERQMQALAADPEADLCYTARVQFTEEGGQIRRGKVLSVPPPGGLREALYRNTTFMSSSIVVRRTVYLAAGGYDQTANFMDDWDFWLRLLHSGTKFAYCPEPLLLYRVHTGSMSHNVIGSLRAAEKVYRQHVLPRLPAVTGWRRFNRVMSEHQAFASTRLRSCGEPGYLAMMTRSIVRDPFHDAHRYKIWLHMLYTTLLRHRGGRASAGRPK